jgi:ABC-type phosphate/phosphonate transport system substrate-binding protein
MTRLCIGLAAAGFLVSVCAAQLPAGDNPAPDPVNIGLVDSAFVDIPKPLVQILMRPFSGLMKQLTGLNGKASAGGDWCTLGQKLKEGELHLGVFQGFEYAWAVQKDPKLRPLMIAVYYDRHLRSNVVVRKDCPANTLADLKGKDLALPMGTKGHGRLFLERLCSDCGPSNSTAFFNQVVRPEHAEAALDSLCDGYVQAALIDNVSLETYKLVKRGPYQRLKVLQQSEVFPPAVITYYEGALDETTRARLTRGMLAATKNPRTKEMMELFKITSFEPVPEDYTETLANILRVYPPPEPITATSSKPTPGN